MALSVIGKDLQPVLPEQFIITESAVFNSQGVRIIPEEKQNDIDIRIPYRQFPSEKLWVSQMYVAVFEKSVLLTVWLSINMRSTAEADKNLNSLCSLGTLLSGEGMEEVEVKDRPDIFAWQVSTNQKDLPDVLKNILLLIASSCAVKQ